jgi:hypothetical protein
MPTLDERYLEFRDRTAQVFADFPQLEPMRHMIFKELWIGGRGTAPSEWLRHFGRRFLRRVRRQGPLKKAEVLFLMEGRRDLGRQMLLPLWEACRRRGIRTQLVAWNTAAELPAGTHYLHGVRPESLPTWADGAWRRLIAVLPELHVAALHRAFRIASASTAGQLRIAREVLGRVDPRVVVVKSNNISGGVAFSAQARSEGRATVQLQHGVPQAFYTPVLEDVMLTWGESSNNILQALGVPASKLHAVGSPRHDAMTPVPGARPRLCASLGLPDRPTLVFFSNGNDLVRNGCAPAESAAWLEAAATAIPPMNFVVRLHPNEDGSLYRDTPHLCITRDEVDLVTTLSGADIVASVCSTAMYEALLFQKPVWQFCASHWPPLEDNWKQGLAERVRDELDLQTKLRRWLKAPDSRDQWARLAERVFANRGRAAATAADCIAELLEKSQDTSRSLVVA